MQNTYNLIITRSESEPADDGVVVGQVADALDGGAAPLVVPDVAGEDLLALLAPAHGERRVRMPQNRLLARHHGLQVPPAEAIPPIYKFIHLLLTLFSAAFLMFPSIYVLNLR